MLDDYDKESLLFVALLGHNFQKSLFLTINMYDTTVNVLVKNYFKSVFIKLFDVSDESFLNQIRNDSGFIYGIYRQFERWVNRYIKLRKYNKPAFKFSFWLLDVTIFNRDNVSKRYKESCTLGVPVVDKLLATLDMTPSRVMGAFIIHNDIFDYYNKFKPLTSSYNAIVDSSSTGRPQSEEPLSEEGEKTRDGEKNIKR
jgi:hypothetical protein